MFSLLFRKEGQSGKSETVYWTDFYLMSVSLTVGSQTLFNSRGLASGTEGGEGLVSSRGSSNLEEVPVTTCTRRDPPTGYYSERRESLHHLRESSRGRVDSPRHRGQDRGHTETPSTHRRGLESKDYKLTLTLGVRLVVDGGIYRTKKD